MKEILYLHTGTGYLAAHFFNTSQSYFTYGETSERDEILVDHDISFQEGRARDDTVTYTPRAILLDYKKQFGSTANIDASRSGETTENTGSDPALWTGSVSVFQQEQTSQSSYHEFMEKEEDNEENTKVDQESPRDFTSSIFYWSDFSRVYYHPRGLCRLPDPPDWERDVGWARGIERYREVVSDHDIQDDVFRIFAEECDLLQGLQATIDAVSFGSFSCELLSQLRDEYPKLPILSFCSLSPFDPLNASVDDPETGMYILNDAMTLHKLASLSCQVIPLQHPSSWARNPWCEDIVTNFLNPYHSSALLSAHIESITLPLRLKQNVPGSIDMSTLISHLNWRHDTPFSAVTGTFSLKNLISNVKGSEFDFSHPSSLHEDTESLPFSQRAVYRGLNASTKAEVIDWLSKTHSGFREPFHINSFVDIPYPIPSSYPQFFTSQSRPIRVRSVPLHSSIRTTPRTGKLAKAYAQFVSGVSKRYTGVIEELGIERDAIKDTVEDWWKWVGAYEADEEEELEDDRDIDED